MRMTRLRRKRPVAGSGFCSTIGMKVSISMICAASSMTRLSYWKPSATRSRRLIAACVHVMAITLACFESRKLPRSYDERSSSKARHSSSSWKMCLMCTKQLAATCWSSAASRRRRSGGEEVGEGEVVGHGVLVARRDERCHLGLEDLPPREDGGEVEVLRRLAGVAHVGRHVERRG